MKHPLQLMIGFLFFLITLNSCKHEDDSVFPNQIQTSKTSKHERVKGTKVYEVVPPGYTYIQQLARYQKTDDLYMQVIESNVSSFTKAKANLTREKVEAKGVKVSVYQTLKLNGFDAIYSEGSGSKPDEIRTLLIFGDDTFVVMIMGAAKAADTEGIKELREISKSIYYDKSFQLDPLETASFEFDHTITDFKYAATVTGIFVYSEHGKNDIENATANMLSFEMFPKLTEKEVEQLGDKMVGKYLVHGMRLFNKTATKEKINDYVSYVQEAKMRNLNKDGVIYLAVISGNSSSLLITGIAYSDLDDYLAKFKKTTASIQLK